LPVLGGIYGIWVVRPALVNILVGNLAPLKTSLAATADGLQVAQESLQDARVSIASVETLTNGVAQTLADTTPALITTANLIGKDLPASFQAAQEEWKLPNLAPRQSIQRCAHLALFH
jgi:hypothetical protein